MLNKNSSVLFATFSLWDHGQRMPTNGNLESLRNYLIPRVYKLTLIDQPHPGSDSLMPKIEEYINMRQKNTDSSWWMQILIPVLKLTNQNRTQIFFKIRDFLSVIDVSLNNKSRYDYFIGMEGINTLAGIVLKKLGRVSNVIYYVLDYSPNRYRGLMNHLYLLLDRICATHADFIWDVSPAIHPARIKAGLVASKSARTIVVPVGIYPEQIVTSAEKNRRPFSICYLGTLTEEQGPDLAIEALPGVLRKYPHATLHIVGGGQKNLERLKRLTRSLNIEANVIFYGFVVKNSDMAKILEKCFLAIAPYRTFPGSIRQYGDASKLRSYAAAGLPIITTPVPPLGVELQKLGGAIIVPDNKEDLTIAIVSLFSDKKLHATMRKNVIKFAKNNTWDNEFTLAFSQSQT